MKAIVRLALLLSLFFSAGCEYEEVKRETGYKGKARANPWLAAERFVARNGHAVRSLGSWKKPEPDDSVCFMPGAILSNASFTGEVEPWIADGGHLVLLIDHAEADQDDWQRHEFSRNTTEPALKKFLEEMGIDLSETGGSMHKDSTIRFRKESYKVFTDSEMRVKAPKQRSGAFVTISHGSGRVSVITDARIFRSRWIADHDHAKLLRALVDAGANEGAVIFMRSSSLSIWTLLRRHLWPALIGLVVLLIIWLWKNFSRFGPMEPEQTPSLLRGYAHHLEALGDFQWRLDKGAALLAPLRQRIVEGGQQLALKTGRRDDDFFQLLAERAGLTRERVARALTDISPNDSAMLTRKAMDIQRLLKTLKA